MKNSKIVQKAQKRHVKSCKNIFLKKKTKTFSSSFKNSLSLSLVSDATGFATIFMVPVRKYKTTGNHCFFFIP